MLLVLLRIMTNQQQVRDLNVSWNTVYRIVFDCHRGKSAKSFINGLAKLRLKYILKVYKVEITFVCYMLPIHCFLICFGSTSATVILGITVSACVVCLARDVLGCWRWCTSGLVDFAVILFVSLLLISVIFDE